MTENHPPGSTGHNSLGEDPDKPGDDTVTADGFDPGTPDRGEDDSVQQFAEDLCSLRAAAGNPILEALSKRSNISKSVLSDAFRGNRLPTENTTIKVVTALGADAEPWVARRRGLDPRTLRRAVHVDSPATGSLPAVPPGGEPPHEPLAIAEQMRGPSLKRVVAVAAAVGLLAALAGNALWSALTGPGTSGDEPVAGTNGSVSSDGDQAELRDAVEQVLEDLQQQAAEEGREEPDTGVDPMNSICHEDSVIAASEERLDGMVQVQILYSNECGSAWGRITRWDEQSMGNSVRFIVYPQTEGPESDRAQEREAFDVQSVYTPMLIEDGIEARICGVGYITTDEGDDEMELGPPMCI